MRVMERNKSAYWYLLYDRKEPVKNEEGHETGDTRVVYKEAVKRRDNVSAANRFSSGGTVWQLHLL